MDGVDRVPQGLEMTPHPEEARQHRLEGWQQGARGHPSRRTRERAPQDDANTLGTSISVATLRLADRLAEFCDNVQAKAA
jgi:hypothetical protein